MRNQNLQHIHEQHKRKKLLKAERRLLKTERLWRKHAMRYK